MLHGSKVRKRLQTTIKTVACNQQQTAWYGQRNFRRGIHGKKSSTAHQNQTAGQQQTGFEVGMVTPAGPGTKHRSGQQGGKQPDMHAFIEKHRQGHEHGQPRQHQTVHQTEQGNKIAQLVPVEDFLFESVDDATSLTSSELTNDKSF